MDKNTHKHNPQLVELSEHVAQLREAGLPHIAFAADKELHEKLFTLYGTNIDIIALLFAACDESAEIKDLLLDKLPKFYAEWQRREKGEAQDAAPAATPAPAEPDPAAAADGAPAPVLTEAGEIGRELRRLAERADRAGISLLAVSVPADGKHSFMTLHGEGTHVAAAVVARMVEDGRIRQVFGALIPEMYRKFKETENGKEACDA